MIETLSRWAQTCPATLAGPKLAVRPAATGSPPQGVTAKHQPDVLACYILTMLGASSDEFAVCMSSLAPAALQFYGACLNGSKAWLVMEYLEVCLWTLSISPAVMAGLSSCVPSYSSIGQSLVQILLTCPCR